jgi:ATP-dependent helicase/nuclease subunit B
VAADLIGPAALFAALSAERVTLVTPNRRLAAWYKQAFDRAQLATGHVAWPSPDILPWTTFVERTWRELILRNDVPSSPQLIDAHQSQLLWERVIRKSDAAARGLLNIRETARQAGAAWALARAWHLAPAMRKMLLHEDAAAFLGWSERFQELCRERNAIDAAVLPDAFAEQVGKVTAPGTLLPHRLLMAGFDIVPPQQHHVLRILREAGVAVETVMPTPIRGRHARIEFATGADELRACAAWARQRVESQPSARIAIVVPDLKRDRGAIRRELVDSLAPGLRANQADDAGAASSLFNLSLGLPLGDYALVRDALALLEFSQDRPLPYLTVSALMRSPFIAGAETESSARAMLDARLRETVSQEITLTALRARIGAIGAGCERLISLMDEIRALVGDGIERKKTAPPMPATPAECSRYFGRLLTAWGFPGERSLDSTGYQVLDKFRDGLVSLAALQTVQPRIRVEEALAQLRRIAGDTLFQPESDASGAAPIQVLGVLESAGQQFDAIWVTGLADDAWPLAARANAFVPASLQRSAGVTEASAAASLALDRRITAGWLECAAEVVLSHARIDANGSEQERAASALIRGVALTTIDQVMSWPPVPYASMLRAASILEVIPDVLLPPLVSPTRVRGGAGVIRDQAACAFRAFARHRLGARPLEAPQPGLDAAERGNLLHRVLYLVWEHIKDHAGLMAQNDADLAAVVDVAASRAIDEAHGKGAASLTGRFARIEHARLCRVVIEWLQYERGRLPFAVVEREASRNVQLGALSMSLRLDRMDRLDDGTHALIDYKTGVSKLASWLGERPDEPQLPLYFHTAEEEISALAFARVRRGERGKVFGFEGVSAIENLLPDVVPIEAKARLKKQGYVSWDVLTQEWESSLQKLADDFARGVAEVDPKNGGLTCAQCDLHTVCRIAELSGYAALAVDEAPAESADE